MPPTTSPAVVKASPLINEGGLVHRSRARGLLNADNLPALQNLLKRQPEAYVEEFSAQWNHYQSLRSIFASDLDAGLAIASAGIRINKDQASKFVSLISFVTQLAPSYPEITRDLPDHLSDLLLNHHAALSPDIRASCLRSLILLRNRDVITSEQLLQTLFPLLSVTTSAAVRTSVQATILQDIKNANAKSKNHRLNRVVQGLLFGIVQKGIDASSGASALPPPKKGQSAGKTEALWAVRLAANLWKKQIWTDSKTVSLLALGCFHPHPRVQSSAVRFFLGDLHSAEDDAEESGSDDDEGPDVDALMHARKVNKKTRSGDKKMRAAAAVAKKKRKAKAENALNGSDKDTGNFAALYLLNDAQNFGEKLFDNLSRGDREKRHTIEIKIRLMQLLSRVMGAHKLCVLSFYSYVVKYLAPHQQHITHILVSLAQSVHDQTPPDVITPVVRKLSDAFVHPGVSSEVVAAGINSIREICKRQPWAMDETLLEDLISYRKSKDKGVCAASRGLLALYREVNPAMLKKKERGKMGALAVQEGRAAAPFGVDQDEVHGIQGIDLLEKHLEEEQRKGGEDDGEDADDKGWEGWEEESDSDDSDAESEGGWINVSSDDEDGVLRLSDSDSDDDDETRKRKRTVKERLIAARESRQKKRAKLERHTARQARRDAGEDVATSDSESEAEAEAAGSDAEDDTTTGGSELKQQLAAEEQHISKLATTKILTPADFAKLTELRIAAAEEAIAQGGLAGNRAKRQLEELKSLKRTTSLAGNFVDEGDILGPRKKAKATYEDRMASIEKGREDREKYGSKKGKKNKEKESSSTNREKQKTKNFQMIARSWSVRSKKNASLREKSRRLRKHVETSKKRLK